MSDGFNKECIALSSNDARLAGYLMGTTSTSTSVSVASHTDETIANSVESDCSTSQVSELSGSVFDAQCEQQVPAVIVNTGGNSRLVQFINSKYSNVLGMDTQYFLNKYYPRASFNNKDVLELNINAVINLIEFAERNSINLSYFVDDVFTLNAAECTQIITDIKNRSMRDGNLDSESMQRIGLQSKCERFVKKYKLNNIPDNVSPDDFVRAFEYAEKYKKDNDNDKVISNRALSYVVALSNGYDNIESFLTDYNNDTKINTLFARIKNAKGNENAQKEYIMLEFKNYLNELKHLKPASAANLSEEEWLTQEFRKTIGKLIVKAKENDSDSGTYFRILENLENNEDFNNALQAILVVTSDDSPIQQEIIDGITGEVESYTNANDQNQIYLTAHATEKALNSLSNGAQKKLQSAIVDEDKVQNSREKIEQSLANFKVGASQNKNLSGSASVVIIAEADNAIRAISEESYRNINIRANDIIMQSDWDDAKKQSSVEFLNLVTNGNFSKIVQDRNCELNEPVDINRIKSDFNQPGLAQKSTTIVNASKENAAVIQETIINQTYLSEAGERIVAEKKSNDDNHSSFVDQNQLLLSSTDTYIIVNKLLHNVRNIKVNDIIDYAIGLKPLMKKFSDLSSSVQEHIRTCLESQSEDDQISNIDQMDKNSDKVDLALQLKISKEKLEHLHLDISAKQNLELRDDVA